MKISNKVVVLVVFSVSVTNGFFVQVHKPERTALQALFSDGFRDGNFRVGGAGLQEERIAAPDQKVFQRGNSRRGTDRYDYQNQGAGTTDNSRRGTDRYGYQNQGTGRTDNPRRGTDRYDYQNQGAGTTDNSRRGTDRYDYHNQGTGRTDNPARETDRYNNLTPRTDRYNSPTRSNDGNGWRETGPGRSIQGNSQQTFYNTHNGGQTLLRTEGRPLNAELEMWDGPNNTPHRMRLYSEDGNTRPWQVETPGRSRGNTMSVRNSGPMEFPMTAGVGEFSSPSQSRERTNSREPFNSPMNSASQTIQGGSLRTWSLGHTIGSVRVSLYSDGLPITATVELWGVGNHVKKTAEIYSEDGRSRPTILTIQTPGPGDTVAIRNTGPMTFPLKASVEF